ncbi:cobalt-precorrin-5B (C1)-methyltransferase [Aequitasia blattaphilus]|uniref:Cobalt-precorrin-5B C(1)-methyltransferase n=1 Tax=Aequitasia blattaphilus TaxID=2949332 RepID=A0ABT1E8N0_9FIRM|nr:cobalt-precorrin-5B (C(1))-methyltransferase CbiD [Aequitasia blattaphilus]MCP1102175.1 cobalt-precorrin-5B (C(1))-methyltransferase CbiD [Aequitasia blattaphilus]MCR8614815.1 cobalt-precorrin-5B (C(1))-methyltransferase CbiD [Aequitasia blattaphilus]
MRKGYTTGSCAAAAAKAAARMIFTGETIETVSLTTPKGITLHLDVECIRFQDGWVSCGIRKDSGDDPDVTNGICVFAKVEKIKESRIDIKAGEGVGIVTKKGLEQKIGEAAINRVPRRMIREAVEAEGKIQGYSGGFSVLISIPGGEALAKKTFNPRLGIMGGISVLGTTGIVEPMSVKALLDTIQLEMKVLKANGHHYCYVVPGNYGSTFLKETLGYEDGLAVKSSNYIGETIDIALELKMKGLLFVGHAGKLIKLAAGIMNTHSRQADGRMEILAAHAGMAGGNQRLIKKIMGSVATEAAIEQLKGAGLLEDVMESIMEKITSHLKGRVTKELEIGLIMFTMEQGIVGMTKNAMKIQERITEERK